MSGTFIFSLDFELFWGVRDKRFLSECQKQISQVHSIIPRLLSLFKQYEVHVTWAAVGFLMHESLEDLGNNIPRKLPGYRNRSLSPYIDLAVKDGVNQKSLFAPDLVKIILDTPGQELATHTYSHYYCLEQGQSIEEFDADIGASMAIHHRYNHAPKTIVFPRNQYDNDYIDACIKHGIRIYRGNPQHPIYNPHSDKNNKPFKRLARLFDAYINLTGYHTYPLSSVIEGKAERFNVRASRFLRPYSSKLKCMEKIKHKRLFSAMKYAARNHQCYHLWAHPHNFSKNIEENLKQLEKVLKFYSKLRKDYGMTSMTMQEVARSAKG